MSVESVLITRAEAVAGLTALIGTSPARIYFGEMPQNVTLPAVSFERIVAPRVSCMGADPGLVRARFQFDVFADTKKSARLVIDQLRAAYQRWSNASGTVIQDIFIAGDIDLGRDPDTRQYHSAIDFEIIYEE